MHEYGKAICRVYPTMNRANAEDDSLIAKVAFMGERAVIP